MQQRLTTKNPKIRVVVEYKISKDSMKNSGNRLFVRIQMFSFDEENDISKNREQLTSEKLLYK